MRFDVITLFPEMIREACSHSIISRAVEKQIIQINTVNPREFSKDKHRKVDDTPFGGGAGMVLMCQPYFDAFDSIDKNDDTKIILLSPQGKTFNQKMACELASSEQIILMCGHYEGFDERIKKYTNAQEVSIGDFVLTGGELPALCLIDSVSRNLEGCLGKIDSAHFDSFSDGLLEHPHFTKPREYNGMVVPEILCEGNHAKIADWRRKQQMIVTRKKRPDLYENFKKNCHDKKDLKLLNEVESENIDYNHLN